MTKMTKGHILRRVMALPLCLGAVISLAGCSTDLVSMSPHLPGAQHSVAARPRPRVVEPKVTPVVERTRPASDLETGSVTHKHRAGNMAVVIDYWTRQPASTWTGTPAQINMSIHIERSASETTEIRVSRVRTIADHTTTLLDDQGRFAVQPPFSYLSGFTTPDTSKPAMSIATQVDMLVETEPGSGEYFRQTVFDTIKLTFNPRETK